METTLFRVVSVRFIGAAAVASGVLATSTIWLLFTNPTTVTAALDDGRVGPIARELAVAVIEVFRRLLAYL